MITIHPEGHIDTNYYDHKHTATLENLEKNTEFFKVQLVPDIVVDILKKRMKES